MDLGTVLAILGLVAAVVMGFGLVLVQNNRDSLKEERKRSDQLLKELDESNEKLSVMTTAIREGLATVRTATDQGFAAVTSRIELLQRDLDDLMERPRRGRS